MSKHNCFIANYFPTLEHEMGKFQENSRRIKSDYSTSSSLLFAQLNAQLKKLESFIANHFPTLEHEMGKFQENPRRIKSDYSTSSSPLFAQLNAQLDCTFCTVYCTLTNKDKSNYL